MHLNSAEHRMRPPGTQKGRIAFKHGTCCCYLFSSRVEIGGEHRDPRQQGARDDDVFVCAILSRFLEQRDCVCSGQRLLGARMKESDLEAPPKPRVM